MAKNTAYLGEELKYLMTVTASGFDPDSDDYEIELSCGSRKKTLTKADVLVDQQGNHYITVDTSEFKKGDLYATFYAFVPDGDYPDGLRTEIDKQKLTTIIGL